jgi:hypothetical protein
MKYAVIVIVLTVVFTVMGLLAAWGTMYYVDPAERPGDMVPLVFAFFPLGGAAVGLVVGVVAAIVGLLSDRQRTRVNEVQAEKY